MAIPTALDELCAQLSTPPYLALMASEHSETTASRLRQALAQRQGALVQVVQLVQLAQGIERFCTERVVSVDTTASGGNASLLALVSDV